MENVCRVDHWDKYLENSKGNSACNKQLSECILTSSLQRPQESSMDQITEPRKQLPQNLWSLPAGSYLPLYVSVCLSLQKFFLCSYYRVFSTVFDSYTFLVLFCFVHDQLCMFPVGIGWYLRSCWYRSCRWDIFDYRRHCEGWRG